MDFILPSNPCVPICVGTHETIWLTDNHSIFHIHPSRACVSNMIAHVIFYVFHLVLGHHVKFVIIIYRVREIYHSVRVGHGQLNLLPLYIYIVVLLSYPRP